MIKLLIADDESYIRQGLTCCIDWAEYGIQIVGEAVDGEDALKKIGALQPDIVLTDIQMPIINGIELVKKFRSIYPHTKIIVLTAYGSEENFINAIEAGVDGFVLKNANADKILAAVLTAKDKILQEQNQSKELQRISALYSENQHLILTTLFTRLLKNHLPPAVFMSRIAKLEISLPGPHYAVILARTKKSDDLFTIESFMNAFHDHHPFVFFSEDHLLVAILNCDHHSLTDTQMDKVMEKIAVHILGNSITVFRDVESVELLPIAYEHAYKNLEYCFWNWEQSYVFVDGCHFPIHFDRNRLFGKESQLMAAFFSQNEEGILSAFESIYTFWWENRIPRDELVQSATRLLYTIQAATKTDINLDLRLQTISLAGKPDEIMAVLNECLFPKNKDSNKKTSMSRVIDYIQQNYQREVSLSEISKNTYLSPSYISRIFKAETGYSLTEYIHRLRIDKAKELLLLGENRHYEIAEQVGYSNYKYFSIYFNKYCHCSASEYRLMHLND